jgi:hypothetical protein
MRSIILALALASFAQAAAYAQLGPLSQIPLGDIPKIASEQSVPEAKTAPVKEWTLMFYINGKSNVEPFALADMHKLEAAGSSADVNVVAELGRMGQPGPVPPEGNWTGSRRYYVVKSTDTQHFASQALMETPKVDMGDWHRVVDFANWAKQNYPAKHYMLLVWDHGWGWLDPTPAAFGSVEPNRAQTRSVSHDFEYHSYIATTQLGPMLKATGGVDVYASMACFMQMAEITWELKDFAKVIVGSEEVIQLPSFDFTSIIKDLEAKPSADAETLGAIMVDTFRDYYSTPDMLKMLSDTKFGVTLSALRAPMVGGIKPLVDAWVPLAMEVNDTAAMDAAKAGVVRMEIGDETTDPNKTISFYGDMGQFMKLYADNLKADTPKAMALKAASLAIVDYIDHALVIKSTGLSKDRTGKDYAQTHGLSIDIPGQPGNLIDIANNYYDLDFARETKWSDFVRWQTPAAK